MERSDRAASLSLRVKELSQCTARFRKRLERSHVQGTLLHQEEQYLIAHILDIENALSRVRAAVVDYVNESESVN